jgi:hypothetical protein
MKKHIFLIGLAMLIFQSCEQEIKDYVEVTPDSGSADFTNFVALGNSLTAGFQAGALFTEGQNNSFPAIMAKQFALVSSNEPFDQPDINSVNGYNSSFSNPAEGIILGRLILFDPDGTGPKGPGPVPAGAPGVPAPYNSADLPTAYTGGQKLNNFGVPGILLGQALTPLTGGPPTSNPAYNPLYARFASAPGTSTIIGDAIATGPTFFSFWLGNNDVLGYATTGGSGAIPLTEVAAFTAQYTAAINALLDSDANIKGIVATIPDVTAIPFFRLVPYNPIPLDAQTAGYLKGALADNYNAFLGGMVQNGIITAEEREKRLIAFVAGQNPILINDETLTDLTPYMQGDYEALQPYAIARQTTAADLVTLTAAPVLGTTVGGDPTKINGVTVPMGDQYILIPTEQQQILSRTSDFNTIIKNTASGSGGKIAVADINAKFNDVVTRKTTTVDGMGIAATFAPPFGIFSEDGVHPNNRGSAYIARIFIEAINDTFGATVPLPNLANYWGTKLPVSP